MEATLWNTTVWCYIITEVFNLDTKAEAHVQSYVRSWAICGGQSGTGAGVLQVFHFLLPILIPPTAPYSLVILSSTLHSLDNDSAIKQEINKKTQQHFLIWGN
jgi:hypothetical protein